MPSPLRPALLALLLGFALLQTACVTPPPRSYADRLEESERLQRMREERAFERAVERAIRRANR